MGILKDTIREFLRDDCPRMAAALAYYTVFSLPAILILVMMFAGAVADAEDIRGRILDQMRILIGPAGAEQFREILRHADRPGAGSPWVLAVSIGALLFAATGAFAQLQAALNRAWAVEPDPRRGGVRNFLMKRVLSFLMILGVALLLLASMVASTAFTALGGIVADLLPAALSGPGLGALSLGASLIVATAVFAVLFYVLPDARVHWRDAAVGAAATAAFFLAGNLLLGLYLGRSDIASTFGAAGSLAVLLVWVYYSGLAFFLGAELTQVLAVRRGDGIRPSRGAVRVVSERRYLRDGEDADEATPATGP